MGLSWTFGLTFYDIIAPKTSKNIHVWISRLAHAPNHFCYPSWDIVNLWVINKFNQHLGSLRSPNRLLTLSTSNISQFNKPQISVLPNLPSPFHPPTSNLKSLANCWPRQLSLQRSLWSWDILNTRWNLSGGTSENSVDSGGVWAPGRPFFHKGAELRRTSMDRLASTVPLRHEFDGTFRGFLAW